MLQKPREEKRNRGKKEGTNSEGERAQRAEEGEQKGRTKQSTRRKGVQRENG